MGKESGSFVSHCCCDSVGSLWVEIQKGDMKQDHEAIDSR